MAALRRVVVVAAVLGLGLGWTREARAISPIEQNWRGIAIDGTDPVAYFTESRAVEGSKEFEHEWMGATWRFSSAANRDRFRADPERYAPQYGGYCAWAVGHGYTAPTDPAAWSIVDGKLYLNYDLDVQQQWAPEKEKWIEAGDRNWPGLRDED
jgi:YHS domain-containing protein